MNNNYVIKLVRKSVRIFFSFLPEILINILVWTVFGKVVGLIYTTLNIVGLYNMIKDGLLNFN